MASSPQEASRRAARALLALPLALGLAASLRVGAAEPETRAAAVAATDAPLPAEVRAALDDAAVADANAAFLVLALDGGALRLARNADAPMNPASVMKLLTTYAALSILGPDFRWHTEVLATRRPVRGRLDGDLIVRGDGDPSLVIERWWLLLQRVRALGVRDIRGDLVLDRSRYAPAVEAGPSLDGNDLRPYNVAPDALLINFKALSLDFVPDPVAGVARIVATPQLDGVRIPAQVPLAAGACGDWHARLEADFANPRAPAFRGAFPRACERRTWHVSLLTPDQYALASFRALWRAAGGTLHGGVRAGVAGANAVPIAEAESPPLAEVVREINKNSNNVMARQLFLALGLGPQAETPATTEGPAPDPPPLEPASPERSIGALRAWLEQAGLPMPELVLQNGSGLSRRERISAASLGRLLAHAWRSAQMPNFLASLPQPGIDGTMKDRPVAGHAAFVKTGYLADVRAIAGYVFAVSGHHYAVVALVNDPHAEAAQAALDGFLQWVWQEG